MWCCTSKEDNLRQSSFPSSIRADKFSETFENFWPVYIHNIFSACPITSYVINITIWIQNWLQLQSASFWYTVSHLMLLRKGKEQFKVCSYSTASALRWIAELEFPSLHWLLHCSTARKWSWSAVHWAALCTDQYIGNATMLQWSMNRSLFKLISICIVRCCNLEPVCHFCLCIFIINVLSL